MSHKKFYHLPLVVYLEQKNSKQIMGYSREKMFHKKPVVKNLVILSLKVTLPEAERPNDHPLNTTNLVWIVVSQTFCGRILLKRTSQIKAIKPYIDIIPFAF
jgi:hypothetical protein